MGRCRLHRVGAHRVFAEGGPYRCRDPLAANVGDAHDNPSIGEGEHIIVIAADAAPVDRQGFVERADLQIAADKNLVRVRTKVKGPGF